MEGGLARSAHLYNLRRRGATLRVIVFVMLSEG